MSKPYNIIILPLYSGADEAFSHNSNTHFHSTTPDTTATANTTSLTFMGFAIFPIFFNSAARRYYTRTSRYRTLLGLTKLASVIQTQTLHQTNTSNMALLGKQQYHFDVTTSVLYW